jgi:cytochrome b
VRKKIVHTQLLAHSPLLVLPLVAMFLFLAVWVVTAVRAMTRSRVEIEAAARLLEDDHERR